MVMNWWKEISDSQEQLWGVGAGWLLCQLFSSTTELLKRWGGNGLAGEARLDVLTGKIPPAFTAHKLKLSKRLLVGEGLSCRV